MQNSNIVEFHEAIMRQDIGSLSAIPVDEYTQNYGETPYHTAASNNTDGQTIRALSKLIGTDCLNGYKWSPLHCIFDNDTPMQEDTTDLIHAVLELGVDLKIKYDGITALHSAAISSNL
jgi:ankyrin repeat protein